MKDIKNILIGLIIWMWLMMIWISYANNGSIGALFGNASFPTNSTTWTKFTIDWVKTNSIVLWAWTISESWSTLEFINWSKKVILWSDASVSADEYKYN